MRHYHVDNGIVPTCDLILFFQVVEATCPTTESIDFAIVDVSTITGVLHFALDSTRFACVFASTEKIN